MMMISAKELEERDKRKKEMKKEFYTRILSQMCRKIDMMNSMGRSECYLRIPEFIFGYPSYNVQTVSLYVHRQLVRLGYRCSMIDSMGNIHVAWGKLKKEEENHQTKHINEEDASLPSLANLKKTADSLRKKYESSK